PTLCDLFLFQCIGDDRALHSFPTRRSSDLPGRSRCSARSPACASPSPRRRATRSSPICPCPPARAARSSSTRTRARRCRERVERSEEHTSELQSRSDLVCRLLLEKKKQTVI